ncbi:ABC transporter substrate-binding protein [Sinorhizobium medicae]|uniref:ABC transporter substrate-binding protein n=1 Tax=Sinorhizobium medicae TaxID=110321 RepID=UPI0012977A9B|nr:ABC transporter substrate-binding protein [Sinorhizobium medicae]MQV49715.1 ABC transporter substrate-binding protein [Sinorhizobium medicae]MQV52637.1 ABC transporter substrate-binding protein [Sinorhizobium medicae]MQV75158.1 ABC transporter substrate-binding protein [Sinorhizobium medicae]WQO88486.1 ABC transporter substrate-binding protein [Sinorhizobium medicae]
MKINRREVLRSALGSSIMISGLGSSTLSAIAYPAQAPNTLTWIALVSYRNMNPASNYDSEIYVLGNVYETLFVYRDDKVQPKLATSWERSDDGKIWTVHLRKGVKFHDGSPLNSAAVKKSFEYVRDLGKGAGFFYAGLEGVETPDEHTAIFRFKNTIAFDLVAAGQYGGFVIGPAAIDKGDEWLTQGNAIGTGPYKLTKFEQGKLVVLDKFEDYWDGWQSGQIERIIHPYIAEASTRVQMIRSGQAGISTVPASEMKSLDALPNVSVRNAPSWVSELYMLNTQKYPTDNLKFRQALQHLWDHDTVISDIFHGTATKPVAPIVSTMWGHGTYDVGTFDPQKALALLEESGVPKEDWKIEALFSSTRSEPKDAIELFQANAAAIGLDVELSFEQVFTTYLSKARSHETAGHMNGVQWWPGYPTPSDTLVSLFHTEKQPAWNLSYYYDEEYDRLVDQALGLEGLDIAAAAKGYIAAQDRLMQEAVAIFYADINRVNACSSNIKGMEEASNPAYEWLSIYDLRV